MPISVRLKPELAMLLEKAARRNGTSRSALIQEALTAFLKPNRPKLGAAIRRALVELPQGAGIEREQPKAIDKRNWEQ